MKLLILIMAMAGYAGCNDSKKPVTIVVDFSHKGGWRLMEGDSIWWSMGEFIIDPSTKDSVIQIGRSLPQDTLWGLKNFKPLVLIKDNGDTMRYWFGDTVRFNVCKPDTVVIYKTIQHADKVIIGGN